MKNIFLSVVVVTTLVAAGVGGTFAGFVDTEISEGNFVQAGVSDLLVNGKNDPIGPKLRFVHAAPCKSVDFWVDVYNWGECQGGDVYLHFMDVDSTEDGTKLHNTKSILDLKSLKIIFLFHNVLLVMILRQPKEWLVNNSRIQLLRSS